MKFFVALLIVTLAVVSAATKFKLMHKSIPRKTFVKHSDAEAEVMHELVFAIKQKNLAEFDKVLLERSTPGSKMYQKWLTFDEVGAMTSNPTGAASVQNWLEENNIPISWQSAHQDYIRASAPISKWEKLLNTKFYKWEDKTRPRAKGHARLMHRAEHFSLPEEMTEHLSTVFNTVQVPPVFRAKYRQALQGEETPRFKTHYSISKAERGKMAGATAVDGTVTVAFLNEFYDIVTNEGSPAQSQSVFETVEESYSPTDLTLFQQKYNLTVQAALHPYGFNTTDCVTYDCGEGNLDVQYIMGVAQQTATIYWYVTAEDADTDPFVAWVTDIANSANPPLANSMSWGSVEQANSQDVMDAFNTEAMKLTSMGVTVTVSSGDNGAGEEEDLCEVNSGSNIYLPWTGTPWYGKGYFPSFPATSPYVTAVGATMGPEAGDPEIACQSQEGGVITTGGGFSNYYPTPSWQTDAVNAYFNNIPASDQQPSAGFNRNGRGYPDVSMIGVWYQVFIQGELTSLFGTSASAPLFAALVSLTNAARAQNGSSPLGFLNPTLYSYGSTNSYFNDITAGNNKCMANGNITYAATTTVCCESGFNASIGWDPLTGFGSLNYPHLQEMFGETSEDGGDDDQLSNGAIAGIVIGCVAFVALLGAGALYATGAFATAGASAAASGSSTAATGGAATGAGGKDTAVLNPVGAGSQA